MNTAALAKQIALHVDTQVQAEAKLRRARGELRTELLAVFKRYGFAFSASFLDELGESDQIADLDCEPTVHQLAQQLRLRKFNTKIARLVHRCLICKSPITFGRVFHDGGHARRGHVECVQ